VKFLFIHNCYSQAGATTEVVQMKLIYLFLCNYAESNSELSLLTFNTLVKDTQDRNPMIRGLALRSMCSLRYVCVYVYTVKPVNVDTWKFRHLYDQDTWLRSEIAFFHIKQPGKSGNLDYLDIFCWSQGIHNTRVPLSSCVCSLCVYSDPNNIN